MSDDVLNKPWEEIERQRVATQFGMWAFLATETLFFGAIFMVYTVARLFDEPGFTTGARETDIVFGTVNTAILLTSSLTMAVGERAVREGLARLGRWMFAATIACGLAFLVVKGFEYHSDIDKHLIPGPGFRLGTIKGAGQFWAFYWTATVVHACHLTIGLGVVARLLLIPREQLARRSTTAEGTALYWHLIDVVWLFLYPLLYLVGRP